MESPPNVGCRAPVRLSTQTELRRNPFVTEEEFALKLVPAILIALLSSSTLAAPAKTARCQKDGIDIARAVEVVEAYRAYKGADGLSHIEKIQIPGKKGAFYGGKVRITQFDLGDPTGASFVYGEPNMEIPIHPVPYRETFIILSGSSVVKDSNGKAYPLKPGTMLIADDLGTPGRSGSSGPCGYVALSLAYKGAPK